MLQLFFMQCACQYKPLFGKPERAGEVPQRSKPMETFEIFQKIDFSSQRSVNCNEEKLTVIHKRPKYQNRL